MLSGTHVDYRVAPSRLLRTEAAPMSSDDVKAILTFDVFFAHPTIMMRRSCLDQFSLTYEAEYFGAEDFRLYTRLARHGRLAFIPEPLLALRTNHPSITSTVPLICAGSAHRVIAGNFRELGLPVEDATISRLFRPDQALAEKDMPLLSQYLRTAQRAADLVGGNRSAATGYRSFVSNLFEALALKSDIGLLAAVFRREGLMGHLKGRSKVLAALGRLMPARAALEVRNLAVQVSQHRKSSRFREPSVPQT